MTFGEILRSGKYKEHHTSWARGYIPRTDCDTLREADPYDGRFGKGYKVHLPTYASTRYHRVQYWIEEVTA